MILGTYEKYISSLLLKESVYAVFKKFKKNDVHPKVHTYNAAKTDCKNSQKCLELQWVWKPRWRRFLHIHWGAARHLKRVCSVLMPFICSKGWISHLHAGLHRGTLCVLVWTCYQMLDTLQWIWNTNKQKQKQTEAKKHLFILVEQSGSTFVPLKVVMRSAFLSAALWCSLHSPLSSLSPLHLCAIF